jgi:hypothetical protein
MRVTDPYLRHATPDEANYFFAAYALWLALGNTIWGITVKSGTIKGYLKSAADLVQKTRQQLENKKYPDPRVDVSTGKTFESIDNVTKEIRRWETMPRRREALTKGMLIRLSLMIPTAAFFTLLAVLLDWFVLGIHTGFRRSEYAQ